MQWILWRHAEADFSAVSDLERALTQRGHEQAEKTANWLKQHLPDDYLLVSSQATRAQETASHLGEPLVDTTFNVDSSVSRVRDGLERLAKKYHSRPIVLVAHQPFTGMLAAELAYADGLSSSVSNSAGYWLEETDGKWRCKTVFSPESV